MCGGRVFGQLLHHHFAARVGQVVLEGKERDGLVGGAARLVEVAEGFDACAEVSLDGQSSGADSIMGLLMLAASKGKTIDVRAWGADAEALANAVEALVADRFGEDM